MVATVAGIHLGLDTHANRPAGNACPDGSFYSCSTHSLIYKSNFAGNSWATWATLGTAGGSLTVEDEGTPLATAATTLDFVGAGVTATGAGADKTITIPGGSGGAPELPLDAAATAAVGSGDLFTGTSLDGGWSSLQATALDTVSRAVDGYLILGNNGAIGANVFRGIDRAFSPAGDFTVWTRVDWSRIPGNYAGFVLFFGATDPSDAGGGNRCQIYVYYSGFSLALTFDKVAAGAMTNVVSMGDASASPLYMQHQQLPIWLALRRVGTAVSFGFSQDGVEWTWHSTTTTIGFTVNTIGLGINSHSTSNPPRTIFDYIATTG
jgi:hypothetical protein